MGTVCQGQTCKMFCSSTMPRVPALRTSTCSMLSIVARVCEGDRVLGAALEAWQGTAMALRCPGRGLAARELPMVHPLAYLGVE